MNVVFQPFTGYLDHVAIARSYGVLKLERCKIDVCLRNHSAKQITLLKQTAVGEITASNVIPTLLALRPTEHESGKGEVTVGKREGDSQKTF